MFVHIIARWQYKQFLYNPLCLLICMNKFLKQLRNILKAENKVSEFWSPRYPITESIGLFTIPLGEWRFAWFVWY